MPSATVTVDCTGLDDEELNEVADTLSSSPEVDDVTVSIMGLIDDLYDEDTLDDEDALDLQASAEPVLLGVRFVGQHWQGITGGASGAVAVGKAAVWLTDTLKTWSEKRKGKYELRPIYDAECNVVVVVKVKKP